MPRTPFQIVRRVSLTIFANVGLAWGVGPRSRLGCQIIITDALDGIELTLPAETNNQMDG